MDNNEMLKLTIDGKEVEVKKGSTVLDAARKLGIDIPTLCFLKEINEIGACRMCLVEVEGARGYVTSCVYPAEEGMKVKTSTKELVSIKKTILELLLSNHEKKCLTCSRNLTCELQALCRRFGVEDLPYEGEMTEKTSDKDSSCITRNTAKCILCKRCVNVCRNVQGVSAIEVMNRGFKSKVGVWKNLSIAKSTCVGCGQCIVHCPTAALKEKSCIEELREVLTNKEKVVIVQTAPSVRATIGEEFGMEIGTLATGKMVAALKKIGFDKVFDTDLGADITIMEEGTEFLSRLNNKGTLPMITSCSSGWITYAEKFYPELLNNLSTTKSPMEIMGILIKKYYASKFNIDPNNIYSVALMPCSAKKAEIVREELKLDGMQIIDNVVTTREIARLLRENNIDLSKLDDEEFDNPLGEATGAGHIFGVTGGVMEAAIRTVYEMVTNSRLKEVEFNELRDSKGIKEAVIDINGTKVNVCVAQGLKNASKVMEDIKNGTSKYHFIEIMTCPGGCIMGGGQPIHTDFESSQKNIRELRASALYKADKTSKYRISKDNPSVELIYKEYFEEPNGKKAHELLHTKYNKQEVYVEMD